MMSFASLQNLVSRRSMLLCAALSVSVLPLSGCELGQNYLKADREGGNEIQDYRDAMNSRVESETEDAADAAAGNVPELQPYIASPDTNMKSMPLVSVSVNQTVPLKDVLYELAEQANYDLELDPGINGAIIFTARERPFDEVVDRIADMAGLRYKFENDRLRIEVDTPYNKLYKIDYLSYIRNNKSQMSSDISVVKGDGVETGSGFSNQSEAEINFWGEVEENLKQILGGAAGTSLKTRKDPRITATAQNPDVETVAPPQGGANGEAATYQPPEAVLNVSSLPVEGEEEDKGGAGAKAGESEFTYSINKQGGMINIYANEKAHKEMQEYLKVLKRSVTSQVLIEAKILEVQLNDEFATGVDWNSLTRASGKFLTQFTVPGSNVGFMNENQGLARAANANGVFTGNANFVASYAGDVDVLVQALSGFGTVKALASPRLTVLNNQPAMLNVSTNRVFFEVDIDVSNTDNGVTTDISSTSNSVPEGIIVNVQPSIDLDNDTVSMAVRPTITEVVNQVPDPAVQYITAQNNITNVVSNFPELNVQEIDSVIQVRSGQPVVMGGLLQDRVTGVQEGVPVLGEIPLAGALFRKQGDLIKKTEIIIFLKATILGTPGDSIGATDKDLYRKFSSDRRPLKF